jgi:mannose-1-phosphate guanylyltransferase
VSRTYALILAGGSGTRFWPASRRHRPKQLLAIAPGSQESLLASTVRRIAPLCPASRVVIATGEHLVEATRQVLPELPPAAFLGEPLARNTAACIGWGTARILRADPDAVVMALPSDHHIGDEPAFLAAVTEALASAESGTLTTIGIEPTHAETGYGYIEAGQSVQGRVRQVVRFVEKPDLQTAEAYVASGKYYWNSGMFFFRARDMMAAIDAHMPELSRALSHIEEVARREPAREAAETRSVFEGLSPVSIDYGVMERMDRLHVVPAQFGWSDLGSWEAAYALSVKDGAGNAADPGTLLVDARRNLVRDLRAGGAPRVIALVGVSDLCVVETEDALLILPRDRAQDVREVVRLLEEAQGRDAST